MKQQLDDRNDNTGDWNPLDEKQAASTSRYGLSKELYDEIFHLVKQCKTMILKEQGVKVSRSNYSRCLISFASDIQIDYALKHVIL